MPEDADERTESLHVEKLVSGDRPSIYALGVFGAHALRQFSVAVFMVDVLGHVHLMPPDAVSVAKMPRVSDEELDLMSEEAAINVMIKQEDAEATIISYLKRRSEKEGKDVG